MVEDFSGNYGIMRDLTFGERLRMSKYIHDYRADMAIVREVVQSYRETGLSGYHLLGARGRDVPTVVSKAGYSYWDGGSFLHGVLGWIDTCWTLCVAMETFSRGAIVMTAIRLFEIENSRLPKDLTELESLVTKDLMTDPFSGNSFVYIIKGDDFSLLSVGKFDGTAGDSIPIFERDSYSTEDGPVIFHMPK